MYPYQTKAIKKIKSMPFTQHKKQSLIGQIKGLDPQGVEELMRGVL